MSDGKALLAAIWEHPHEDTPRLVYADWLQENEQPERAEFIRVQCALAQFDQWDDSPQKAELERREQALWKKHAKVWKAHLPKLLQAAPFRRGFPAPRRRALTGNQFLKLTPSELAPAPLWDVHVSQARTTISKVVASAPMARVGVLELPINELVGRAADVLAAGRFPNVADLAVDANWIGEPGIAALAANPSLGHLRALSAYSSDVNDTAAAVLASAPWFPRLRALSLGNNPFGPDGLRALVARAGADLRELTLGGLTVGGGRKRFDDESLLALLRAPLSGGLRALDLGINYHGNRAVELLRSDGSALRLRRLVLNNNALTEEGIVSLAGWPGLATVEHLDLTSNAIGPRGARALIGSPHFGRLRSLWLLFATGISGHLTLALQERFGPAVRFR